MVFAVRPLASVALFGVAMLLVPMTVRASEGGIVALAPQPNEHVNRSPKAILIRVAGRSALNKSAAKVVVDGRDVSDAISATGNVLQYNPAQPLSNGDHAVEVAVTDAGGGRLSYTWTFTVDDASISSKQHDSAAQPPLGAGTVATDGATAGLEGGTAADALPSANYASTPPQDVYVQQNFAGFYPIGAGPYYWGDNAQFEFMGLPGGYGFLTFAGIPGVFDLLPLGLNTFYATVPIPVGFVFIGNPPVTCHFFAPNGTPTIVRLPSFPIVRHRRKVATSVVREPVFEHATSRYGASERVAFNRAPTVPRGHAPGLRTLRPIGSRPLLRMSAAPRFAGRISANHRITRTR